jgi:magnesium transporter
VSTCSQRIRLLTATRLRELGLDELAAELAALSKADVPITWVHVEPSLPAVQALDDMGLDEIAVKSLRDGPERPRVEEFADHLYVSLFSADKPVAQRVVERCPADGSPPILVSGESLPTLRELRLFLGPRWIISVGDIDQEEYETLVERMNRQVFSRGRGPSFIVYHICEWLVESLQPTLEQLDDRIDSLEDQVVLATGEAPMQGLFSLKRDLVDLRRRVAPLRDVMQRLGSHGVLFVEAEAEVYFRDVHDDVMRNIELLDTYRDILSSALDLHLSSVSNRLNRVMKQLTVVATLFMPLSFIVGLFGTNFIRMPFASSLWFYLMFVMLFLSLLAMLVFSWKRT